MKITSFFDTYFDVDRIGTIASSVCALHCVLCALAPALLMFLNLDLLVSHEAEWVFTLIAAILAVVAARRGYCSCRSWKLPAILLTGVIVLFIARFAEKLELGIPETIITVAGGCILVGGHLNNLRACSKDQNGV